MTRLLVSLLWVMLLVTPGAHKVLAQISEIHASFVYEASGGDPVGVNSVDVSDAGQHVG